MVDGATGTVRPLSLHFCLRYALLAGALCVYALCAAEPAPAAGAVPPAKPAPEFTFVVAADPHIAEVRRGPCAPGTERFGQLMEAVLNRPRPPEFMILIGDIVPPLDPRTKLPDISLLTAAARRLPIYPVAGNMDFPRMREALRKGFPDAFGERDFYAFTRHQCRFVMVCDAAVGDHYGHVTSESIRGQPQWAWLESQLQRDATVRRVFVFGHIPPHPTGADAVMYLSLGDQKLLADMVARYTPEALFFGHCHGRQDFTLGTSPVHVLPSCHWNMQGVTPAFVEVSVFPDAIALDYVELPPERPPQLPK